MSKPEVELSAKPRASFIGPGLDSVTSNGLARLRLLQHEFLAITIPLRRV